MAIAVNKARIDFSCVMRLKGFHLGFHIASVLAAVDSIHRPKVLMPVGRFSRLSVGAEILAIITAYLTG
jgi:hypothetical protein